MAEYIEREALLNTEFHFEIVSDGGEEFAKVTDVVNFIEKFPAADVAPVVRKLQPAVRLLHKEYERANTNPVVRNPLAYALFQTWKAVENRVAKMEG